MSKKTNLSDEEQKILSTYGRGELVSVTSENMKKALVLSARNTFLKDRRVNIRMTGKDLELLQERALLEGIPYQTLMSSVLHKYVHGRLVDRN